MRLLVAILLLGSFAAAQPFFPRCRMVEIRRENGVDLYLDNRYGVEVTMELEATVTNLSSSDGNPICRTVPGNRRTRITSLRRVDERKRWRYDYRWRWVWGSTEAEHDEEAVYRLPWTAGESYPVSQGFGGEFSHTGENHYAVDFKMPVGTPIRAAREGTVADVEADYALGGRQADLGGNHVMIRHEDGTVAEYFHLKQDGVVVKPGTRVEAGDLLGYSGNTGFTDGPHLHFMVFKARDGKRRQSFPVRFRAAGRSEPIVPQQGETCTAE